LRIDTLPCRRRRYVPRGDPPDLDGRNACRRQRPSQVECRFGYVILAGHRNPRRPRDIYRRAPGAVHQDVSGHPRPVLA